MTPCPQKNWTWRRQIVFPREGHSVRIDLFDCSIALPLVYSRGKHPGRGIHCAKKRACRCEQHRHALDRPITQDELLLRITCHGGSPVVSKKCWRRIRPNVARDLAISRLSGPLLANRPREWLRSFARLCAHLPTNYRRRRGDHSSSPRDSRQPWPSLARPRSQTMALLLR